MKYGLVSVVLVLCLAWGGTSFGLAQNEISVVASTTWVGAMIRALGIDQVSVLAPVEMRHPAEYDFRPGDIALALDADYVAWAGYEPFIRNLVEAANISEERVLQVHTNNSPPVLEQSVAALAETLGLPDAFAEWQKELHALAAELQRGADRVGTENITVAVQAHQQRFVEWLGYDVVVVFGPGEITPGKIGEIEDINPALIIDNWHSAQGEAFAREGRGYYTLLNFPGSHETASLLDVLRYNGRQLGLLSE